MTTFTIYSGSTGNSTSGLTAIEAARELLGYDGHEFEIRRADGGGHELWVSMFSRNSACFSGLTRSVIFSIKDDPDGAEEDISQRVIKSGFWENGNISVMTDEAFSAMQEDQED